MSTNNSEDTTFIDETWARGFRERLKLALKDRKIDQIARAMGVSPSAVYNWMGGVNEPTVGKLVALASATHVALDWLISGKGPYGTTEFEPADATPPLAFHDRWLFELIWGTFSDPVSHMTEATNPPLLMEVQEDSMEPTFTKGDLLVVDQSFGLRTSQLETALKENRSVHAGIYVFKTGSLQASATKARRSDHDHKAVETAKPVELLVRRVQYRVNGTMIIKCDNSKYTEECYAPDAVDRPRPLGRVVWCGHRM